MSDHRLTIDIQKFAEAIQDIRKQLDALENEIQEALLAENKYE